MRALRYYGPEDLRLETDVPEPKCGSMQVKIRNAFVGICGTDLHEYRSQTFIPKPGAPHPLSKESAPVTLGHEISGTIVEVGSDVPSSTALKVGDRVAVFPLLYCRSCEPCKNGFINCCVDKGFLGLSGGGGGLSDYVCVQPEAVFKLPDNISLEVGALVEPLAVAWHAVSQSTISAVQPSLVFGTGPIGLSIIQCLKAMGAGDIIAVEIAPRRQRLAKEFGASHILDPAQVNVTDAVRELTGGNGLPVAFDCAGVPLSVEVTTRSVCARGVIVNVAIWEKPVDFALNDLVFYERRYIGCLTYLLGDFDRVIDALRTGHLKPERMITSKVPLERAIGDGFKALMDRKDEHIKLMVDLSATVFKPAL